MHYTKNDVPKILRDSRDFQVFLRLLDIVYNTSEYDTTHLYNLYDADECPSEFLPLLANLIGYKYDNSISVAQNRFIIKNYKSLMRAKGSPKGIKLAVILSVLSEMYDTTKDELGNTISKVSDEDVKGLSSVSIDYDYPNGVIKIYYPPRRHKTKDLVDAVRPIGMRVEYYDSDSINISDQLLAYDNYRANIRNASNTITNDSSADSNVDIGVSQIIPSITIEESDN